MLNYPIAGTWDRNWHFLMVAYLDAQNGTSKPPAPSVFDGRVDPLVGGRFSGARHHMTLIIVLLNLQYAQLRASDFPRMAEAGDCPVELRQKLKWKVLGA